MLHLIHNQLVEQGPFLFLSVYTLTTEIDLHVSVLLLVINFVKCILSNFKVRLLATIYLFMTINIWFEDLTELFTNHLDFITLSYYYNSIVFKLKRCKD
jgi:hypothetical protein